MKRTKEAYFRYHPDPSQREGLSGLKDFDGEDLGKQQLQPPSLIINKETDIFNRSRIKKQLL